MVSIGTTLTASTARAHPSSQAILKGINLRGKLIGQQHEIMDDDISHVEDDAEEFDENGGILNMVDDPLKSDDEDW